MNNYNESNKYSKYYITDPLKYLEYKHKNEKIKVELSVLIEEAKSNSDFLQSIIKEMNERNEMIYQKRSKGISLENERKRESGWYDSQELKDLMKASYEKTKATGYYESQEAFDARSRGAKTSNKNKVESGYYQSKKHKTSSVKGGKNTQEKRKEEGYYESVEFEQMISNVNSIRGKKSGAKKKAKTDAIIKQFLSGISSDVVTRNDLFKHAEKTGLRTKRQVLRLLSNEEFIVMIKKGSNQHDPGLYKIVAK